MPEEQQEIIRCRLGCPRVSVSVLIVVNKIRTKCLLFFLYFFSLQTGASPLPCSCPSLPHHLRLPCSHLRSPPAVMSAGPPTWDTWDQLLQGQEAAGSPAAQLSPRSLRLRGCCEGYSLLSQSLQGQPGYGAMLLSLFTHPYSQGTAVLRFIGMPKALAH